MPYLSFSVRLTLLSMIFSKFIYIGAKGTILSFFMGEKYLLYICTPFFLNRSFVDGRLGCFQLLAFVNSVAMNFGVRVSF